jgi:hypothetical protein
MAAAAPELFLGVGLTNSSSMTAVAVNAPSSSTDPAAAANVLSEEVKSI